MTSTDPEHKLSSKVSEAPFSDSSKADLILRSSDLVDFYILKALLSLVSPVFEDMFSLPQPHTGTETDRLAVISLSESSETLKSVLSFIDPRVLDHPQLSLKQAFDACCASDKYQMESVLHKTAAQLRLHAVSHPLQVYLLVVRECRSHTWACPLTRFAARELLHMQFSTLMDNIVDMPDALSESSEDLLRLIRYHILCGRQAKNAARDFNSPLRNSSVYISSHSKSCYAAKYPTSNCLWHNQYQQCLERLVVHRPLGQLLPEQYDSLLQSSSEPPKQLDWTCLNSILTDRKSHVQQVNQSLALEIDDAISKVDLGLDSGHMPFVVS